MKESNKGLEERKSAKCVERRSLSVWVRKSDCERAGWTSA